MKKGAGRPQFCENSKKGTWHELKVFGEMAKTKFAAAVALAEMEAKSARKEEAMIWQGEKRRSILTGKVYKVKAIDDWSVILESLDGSSEVCTEWDNLKLFYENLEEADNLKN